MKQVIQNLKNGETSIQEGPDPINKPGHILIASEYSLISSGTERMLKSFGEANLINKAKQQPDKVKQTIDKIQTDGMAATFNAVMNKLDEPIPLGYSNVGIVLESDVNEFKEGDRVVSNGSHAEIVCVPANLCAKVPDTVDKKSAAFTVVSSIGLQGIRLLNPSIGENIAVYGLGLIGLIVIQILKSNGCNVLAIDSDPQRCSIAESLGFKALNSTKLSDQKAIVDELTNKQGMDGVIITASTPSNELIHQAADISRIRGSIILIGDIGLDLRRDDFYKKELKLQVSSSYGPGRYDKNYEDKGNDYPFGFVRWTAKRNFEAIIDLINNGSIDFSHLVSSEFDIKDAANAYDKLSDSSQLGIVIKYPDSSDFKSHRTRSIEISDQKHRKDEKISIGFIGSGSYASKVLIPAFKSPDVFFNTLASRGGQSGIKFGKKFGFKTTTTDSSEIFENDDINTIVIATRHNQHFLQAKQALLSGKNVFIEKPLVLTIDELDEIEEIYKNLSDNGSCLPRLMVGFNRRFSPLVVKSKELLNGLNAPKSVIITVNAGYIDKDHWTQDIEEGGGRIIGEGCHFVDLLRFLIGHEISEYHSYGIDDETKDTRTLNLRFSDGSVGSIHYFSNGAKTFPKENIKIFTSGKILEIDNFKKLIGYGWDGFNKMSLLRQDKGNNQCVESFINSIKLDLPTPISFNELIEVSKASINLQNDSNE